MLLPIVSLLCGYKLNLKLKLTSYQFIQFYLATERAILRKKKQNKTKKQVKKRHCCFRLGRESEAQSLIKSVKFVARVSSPASSPEKIILSPSHLTTTQLTI